MEHVKILDHGYLGLVEAWGSDEAIIGAARMSTNKGFLGWGPSCSKCGLRMVRVGDLDEVSPADYARSEDQKNCDHDASVPGDEKLLRYLYEHKHHTPFEMAGLTFEAQAPIFVFREWHRHRVPFGYNEMSARYTPLPDLNYIPSVERLLMNSAKNKQAGVVSGSATLTEGPAEHYRSELRRAYARDQELYERALQMGVPKELARVHLPVGRYSRMRATANLRGWLGFMTLRSAPDAQWEIRQFSLAIGDVIKRVFPRTWELFAEGTGHG